MIKAAFLDIDNTLLSFDGYVKTAMEEGFRRFGLPEYRDEMFPVFERANNRLWRQIEEGTLTFEELQKIRWNRVFEEMDRCFPETFTGIVGGPEFETYFREYIYYSAIPMPGAHELLRGLSERYILCTASNGPYEQQLHRLKIGDMLQYFTYVFVSENIGFSKPSKAYYEECFRRLNEGREEKILPSETVMIGDSLTADVEGGRQYGMKTCYYNFRNRPVPEDAGIDVTVTALEEILPGLEKLE